MIYRNRRTGNVIDVPCEITGEDWELEKKVSQDRKEEGGEGRCKNRSRQRMM